MSIFFFANHGAEYSLGAQKITSKLSKDNVHESVFKYVLSLFYHHFIIKLSNIGCTIHYLIRKKKEHKKLTLIIAIDCKQLDISAIIKIKQKACFRIEELLMYYLLPLPKRMSFIEKI